MPRISQFLNALPKIGNPISSLNKKREVSSSSKPKEGLAARRPSLAADNPDWKGRVARLKSTFTQKASAAPKKLSDFVSRSLTKLHPLGLSKQENINHAFVKAGYDPKGPMAEKLKSSFIQQDNLEGKLEAFDAGQLNTVYTGHFKDAEGELQERILKFETSYTHTAEAPEVFKTMGIDGSYPRSTARNLAAKALDDILGWNSIVPTDIALVQHPQTQAYTVATAMQRAPGVSGYGKPLGFQPATDEEFNQYKQWKEDFEGDPDIQNIINEQLPKLQVYDPKDAEEILDQGKLIGLKLNKRKHTIDPHDPALKTAFLKLQLQDILMNQGDRHIGNYFIHTAPNASGTDTVLGIMGIDNDLLGGKNHEINLYKQSQNGIPKKVICPPPQIPSDLCYEILSIPVGPFSKTMQAYLGKEEGKAAVQRLEQLTDHVMKVLENNRQYGEDSLLYEYHPSNSYWLNFLGVHFREEASKACALQPTPLLQKL